MPTCEGDVSEDADKDRMAALDARLAELTAPKDRKSHTEEHYSQAQLAWRMVIELVAGLGIGFGMGYGLDALFGTTPFLMIIFIFLGLAAGIKTMMRSAAEVQRRQAQDEGPDDGRTD
ncbi:MAG: AtpZ/AtpI family protein [Pseudomonadota bacterium]